MTDGWRWRASYAYLQMQLHTRHSSSDTSSQAQEGNSPHHQFSIHTSLDLPGNVFLDGILRYVDSLPNQNIPSYVGFDLRIAWRPHPNLELSVVGQNLFDPRHPEWVPSNIITQTTEVPRAVYGKVSWKF
jgi:iron complex outermembrane receptor protein